MGKKEKVVELKPKAEKISEEHLKDLQTIVNIVNNLQYKIGQIEGQKHNLLHELGLSQKKIVDLQNTFEKEYGTFDINVADGKINWKKDEE
tara:strand:- start:137 stop:409 length:273 start_codon:yes stop_codon:yes gene_type:complete